MKLSQAVQWCSDYGARIDFRPGKVSVELGSRSVIARNMWRIEAPTLVKAVAALRKKLWLDGRCDGCGKLR